MGNYGLYGYIKDPANKNRLLIDEAAAANVRKIYELYGADNGYVAIAVYLSQRNIANPTCYKYEQGITTKRPTCSRLWGAKTLKGILINEMYLGHMVQGVRRKVSYMDKKVMKVPREQWDIVPNTHQAIISQDMFDTVQALMAGRRTRAEKQSGRINPLAGERYCMDCRRPMVLQGKEPWRYYVCSTYAFQGRQLCGRHGDGLC